MVAGSVLVGQIASASTGRSPKERAASEHPAAGTRRRRDRSPSGCAARPRQVGTSATTPTPIPTSSPRSRGCALTDPDGSGPSGPERSSPPTGSLEGPAAGGQDAFRTCEGIGWHEHHDDALVGGQRFFRSRRRRPTWAPARAAGPARARSRRVGRRQIAVADGRGWRAPGASTRGHGAGLSELRSSGRLHDDEGSIKLALQKTGRPQMRASATATGELLRWRRPARFGDGTPDPAVII